MAADTIIREKLCYLTLIADPVELEKKVRHHFTDIRDFESTNEIINETSPAFLFHLAAQPIVSKSVVITRETGLSAYHLLTYIKTIGNIFSTTERSADPVPPAIAPD